MQIEDAPAILAALRREIGNVIRHNVEGQPEEVRRFAEVLSAAIETGLAGVDLDAT